VLKLVSVFLCLIKRKIVTEMLPLFLTHCYLSMFIHFIDVILCNFTKHIVSHMSKQQQNPFVFLIQLGLKMNQNGSMLSNEM
jgi:hypothetical protein